jgi:hypothetical protein
MLANVYVLLYRKLLAVCHSLLHYLKKTIRSVVHLVTL